MNKWITRSLRTKLLIMFVALTVVPLIVVGVVSYSKSIHVVSENAHTFAQLQAREVSQDIDVLFEDVRRFKEISNLDSTIQFLTHEDRTYEEAKTILNLFSFYREIYQSSNNVISISIFNLDGKIISEDKGVHQLDILPEENPLYIQLFKSPANTLIQPISIDGKPMISITDAVLLEVTGTVIGFINIVIDAAAIEEILHKASLGESGSFFIETESGETLFLETNQQKGRQFVSDWRKLSELESGILVNDSNTVFTVFETLDSTGWKVIGQAPVKELMKDANNIRSLIFFTVACSILFTITLYFFISSKLIRPIRDLKDKMKLASLGDLDVKVLNDSSDEIADLGNSFNSMIAKIKNLLQKSVNEQKQLTMAELRALQSQINPHFLYNTLDNIIWMAESKKSQEVIEMTKALSHFFRITLSKGKDSITLAEEMEHTQNYLIIQKMRYRDILDTSFHINPEILEYNILKLTIQPLVENAIYHGIKNKRGKGLIRIEGDFNDEGDICIHVFDNGIGMDEVRLTEVRKQLLGHNSTRKESSGYGMFNVQQRIQLYYGTSFGLTVNSQYGDGTHVCLTIPARR